MLKSDGIFFGWGGGLWERDVKGKIVASLVIVVFGSFSFFMSSLDLFFFLGYWNLFDNLGFGPLLSSRKTKRGGRRD